MTTTITSRMPAQRDIIMTHGADWSLNLILKQNDRVTPKDLTDWDARMVIRDGTNGEVHKELTVGDGVTIIAAQGRIEFFLAATDVDALDFSRATYKIFITDNGGGATCPFEGDVELKP